MILMKMIVKVCLLFLIYIFNFIQLNVQCSNLVQIDKLHLITPKMQMANNQLNQLAQQFNQRKLNFDQNNEPSINSINFRTNDDRSSSDQVASIQYELKIVQQKPISNTFSNQQQQLNIAPTNTAITSGAVEQPTSDDKLFADIKSEQQQKKELDNQRKNDQQQRSEFRSVRSNLRTDDSDHKLSVQQSKINQAASILQHYSDPIELPASNKKAKQFENHSYSINHDTYPRSAYNNFAQPTNHDFHERQPEIKKIVHIHHYHHEHLGGEGASKQQEKEKEKLTEKLVEKQVQEQVLKSFEEELEREQEKELLKKKKRKKKNYNKKKSLNKLDDESGWKPVKYSDLFINKNGKRKGSHAEEEKYEDDQDDDYKSLSHFHKSKLPTKIKKEHHQLRKNRMNDKYPQLDDEASNNESIESKDRNYNYPKKSKKIDHQKAERNTEAKNDEEFTEEFLQKPLSKHEEDFHRSQLENDNDYSFENDEHYVSTSNRINRHNLNEKLNDEESKEIKKLNKKQKKDDNKKESLKIYNDRPIDVNQDKRYDDQLFKEKFRDHRSDKQDIMLNLIKSKIDDQRLKRMNEFRFNKMSKQFDDQPLIELLNTDVSKRNSQLRRNWLGLELITKNT